MKILSSLFLVRTQDILFDAVEFQRIYRKNPFVLGDVYLTPFSQRVQYLSVQHMEKITRLNVIMKVSYLFQVKMAWSNRRPCLSDLLLVEPEKYDLTWSSQRCPLRSHSLVCI